MTSERRQHARVVRPFDAQFSGKFSPTRCRISDISLGGCFVQTMAQPAAGESVSVRVTISDQTFDLPGVVLYVDTTMGFAVKFSPLPQAVLDDLARVLDALVQGEIRA
jgi:hypothetical protein